MICSAAEFQSYGLVSECNEGGCFHYILIFGDACGMALFAAKRYRSENKPGLRIQM